MYNKQQLTIDMTENNNQAGQAADLTWKSNVQTPRQNSCPRCRLTNRVHFRVCLSCGRSNLYWGLNSISKTVLLPSEDNRGYLEYLWNTSFINMITKGGLYLLKYVIIRIPLISLLYVICNRLVAWLCISYSATWETHLDAQAVLTWECQLSSQEKKLHLQVDSWKEIYSAIKGSEMFPHIKSPYCGLVFLQFAELM